MANTSLQRAHKEKLAEYYTLREDIERELYHYREHFKGKVVLCNCDDPFESEFVKYFGLNFNVLGLKKLIATCYDSSPVAYEQQSLFSEMKYSFPNGNRRAYKVEINSVSDFNNDGAVDLADVKFLLKNNANSFSLLKGNGDFRSDECVELLRQADIVVTNPPFPLFREYIALLMKYEKKFLVIGNMNAITYKEIFPLIKQNKIWLGWHCGAQSFKIPAAIDRKNTYVKDGVTYAKFGNICWYTNLDHKKRHEELILYKKYIRKVKNMLKYNRKLKKKR